MSCAVYEDLAIRGALAARLGSDLLCRHENGQPITDHQSHIADFIDGEGGAKVRHIVEHGHVEVEEGVIEGVGGFEVHEMPVRPLIQPLGRQRASEAIEFATLHLLVLSRRG